RIAVGTSVWTGLPLAEIIDPAGLAFRAEVPERRYARLEEGAAAAVVFPQLGGLRVPGRVTRKARILDLPRDAREEALAPVAPVFAVTIALDIPADRRDDLAPGVKGMLELP
ncbi:MAG: HlyD family secretion protein, partial [Planctomycetes bacterium]|nr:HlyD family secretion protein [Planctomycetota bacterium]